MIANRELLEYATFNGNSYGDAPGLCGKAGVGGKDVILEIEIQGALQVRELYPDALLLFVMPPSADELKERLVGRGTESPEVIAQRLAISAKESQFMPQYDYLVVNDVLEESVRQVHEIIQSEHYRVERNHLTIKKMQEDLKKFERSM